MEFKEKTATEALEKIANAPLEHHWGCDQILIHGLHFSMDDVQAYAKATLNNQPKLSIPKKIAELADETWGYGDIDPLDIFGDVRLPDFEKWWKSQEHPKDLIVAYLAGEALGIELVEVTDE